MPQLHSEQLKAQISRWRSRKGWGSKKVFGLRTDFTFESNPNLEIAGDLCMRVAVCRSDLEAREHLAINGGNDSEGILLLVRSTAQLAEDVCARLAGGQILTLDQRDVLKEIFESETIDPRVTNDESMVDALVFEGSKAGVRRPTGGAMDLDFAWSILLNNPEIAVKRPDLVEVLQWSLNLDKWRPVKSIDQVLIPSFFQWVGERAGRVAKCLETLYLNDEVNLYLPLGLVVKDLYDSSFNEVAGISDARVRVEKYLDGYVLTQGEAEAWGKAALYAIKNLSPEEIQNITVSVDKILESIKALEFAGAFSHSKQGFKDRWGAFAEDLDKLPKRKWENGSAMLLASLQKLKTHCLAPLHSDRISRAEMGTRLAGYEVRHLPDLKKPTGFSSAARAFACDDSFVDWARFTISRGDALPEVTGAYGKLNKRLSKLRLEAQREFGERLCLWNNEGQSTPDGLIVIENVVAEKVAPLAKDAPVLLLVMDGMSFPIFHQLSKSFEESGWKPHQKTGTNEWPETVLSALPSVTTISRWALFSGKIQTENRQTEAIAFREHPALGTVKSAAKPRLFTKGDLSSDKGLSLEVRDAISGDKHQVVAVVVNAIDDQLKTGGQLSINWSIKDIAILSAILEAAAEGERTIVLTSDHGHVPEMENTTKLRINVEGEMRYHDGEVSDRDNERLFTGPRIKAATAGKSITMPVTDIIRYGNKAAGYHGGACDMEVLIPLSVFTISDAVLSGYEETHVQQPRWWDWESIFQGSAQTVASVIKKPKKKVEPSINLEELPLFANIEPEKEAEESTSPDWLAAFAKSEVYQEQVKQLGRSGPSVEYLEKVLTALDQNGGSLIAAALASAIGEPIFRIQGIISRVSRFTNIDGYEVVEFDVKSQTVRLNLKLLKSQFQIQT